MKNWVTLLCLITLVVPVSAVWAQTESSGDNCLECHREMSPGLYLQWNGTKHAENGISCIDCHEADPADVDAFEHHGSNVATLVTPKDCGACHTDEAEQVGNSYHATAGQILESADAYLAHVAAGEPIAIVGCVSCHGARVRIDESSPNKLSAKTWPNSGIGRINPDGSLGSCNACHTRHNFTASQARQPEACGKCHLGPDHPQMEVYEESKHGNVYYTNIDKMNLDSDTWVVGQDYAVAPTCATCHMSATPTSELTHDVGARISWTLRPPISKHKDNWESKREEMLKVCVNCHGKSFAEGHYYQYDAAVRLYNEKFAIPATELIKLVREKKLLEKPASFSNKIEWTYWELWHHEGRRARHGAAMMGPDYAWWHGLYEVAQHFYFKLLPEARHLNDPDVNAFVDSLLTQDEMHSWLLEETTKLKEGIRSGDMQKVYHRLFEAEQKED
jgi:hypothetical protein